MANRYRDKRKPVNLVMDSDVVTAAKAFLLTTRHGSLSQYLEHHLRVMLRRDSVKARAQGISIPESVFIK